MRNTKHDLSFGEVKLDYDALIATAAIAYGAMKNRISEYLNKLTDDDLQNDNTSRYLDAQYLQETAYSLAIAAETYSALLEGKSRETVTIVNKEF